MCENLHYESVYFEELHNDQEYYWPGYWPTIYRAGAAVVSTITSISANIIASHAGVFGELVFHPSPGRDETRAPLKTPAWEATNINIIFRCFRRLRARRRGDFREPSSILSDDSDGSENVTFKMNSRFFKLCRAFSNSPKMLNVGEFPWSWFLGDRTQVWKRK